jgi:CRISPR-associated protein Cmr6
MIDQVEIRKKLFVQGVPAEGINASLWLAKHLQNQIEEKSRQNLTSEVAKLFEPPEYADFFDQWQRTLKKTYGNDCTRKVRVKGRMIVGLGNESVLETSICLHRIYGVPYIPGSALKGLAASYAHQRLGEEWRKGGNFHTVVFGNTDDAGFITFFDALYKPDTGFQKKSLHPDVLTVHHQKYYQDASKAPSDSDDPNPVPFLSATGTYLLALAAPDLPPDSRWIDLTFQILAAALEEFGIGAKTSSGYGRMEFLDPPVKPIDPEIRKAEAIVNSLDILKAGEVAGQLHSYYQQWQQLTSQQARTILAQAILEKVRKAGREKVSAEKSWYKNLVTFVNEKK